MSRIGNKPIRIPENVLVNISDYKITIKGNLGKLVQKIPKELSFKISKDLIIISRINNDKKSKSIHGLFSVLIKNMIFGVNIGFKKKLELVGIGYKVSYDENKRILKLNLGFSHDVMIQVPIEIQIKIKSEKGKNPVIIIKSFDKQLLGIYSAKIRSLRPPEPYKGKGIKYLDENIIRKTGKSA